MFSQIRIIIVKGMVFVTGIDLVRISQKKVGEFYLFFCFFEKLWFLHSFLPWVLCWNEILESNPMTNITHFRQTIKWQFFFWSVCESLPGPAFCKLKLKPLRVCGIVNCDPIYKRWARLSAQESQWWLGEFVGYHFVQGQAKIVIGESFLTLHESWP